jgi:hypothetical protein
MSVILVGNADSYLPTSNPSLNARMQVDAALETDRRHGSPPHRQAAM